MSTPCRRTPKLSSGGLLGMILGKPIKGPPSAAANCSARQSWVNRGRSTDPGHGYVARPIISARRDSGESLRLFLGGLVVGIEHLRLLVPELAEGHQFI